MATKATTISIQNYVDLPERDKKHLDKFIYELSNNRNWEETAQVIKELGLTPREFRNFVTIGTIFWEKSWFSNGRIIHRHFTVVLQIWLQRKSTGNMVKLERPHVKIGECGGFSILNAVWYVKSRDGYKKKKSERFMELPRCNHT